MNVQSFQEKKYSATIAQQYDFSCGSAALATLLTYNYDIKTDEQEIFKDMFENGDKDVISKSGFSLLDIKNYLARRGIESDGYKAPLEKLAAVRVPAIVLVNVRGYAILWCCKVFAMAGCCLPIRRTDCEANRWASSKGIGAAFSSSC